jgi:hypothetical protein
VDEDARSLVRQPKLIAMKVMVFVTFQGSLEVRREAYCAVTTAFFPSKGAKHIDVRYEGYHPETTDDSG